MNRTGIQYPVADGRKRQSWRQSTPTRPSVLFSTDMTNPLLVLQHIACEPPAAYADELRAWGAGMVTVEVDAGESLPDWREFAGIVAMGGPMGAARTSACPG